METLALLCFMLSIGVELYQDVFKSRPPPDNKAVEVLAGAAGTYNYQVTPTLVRAGWGGGGESLYIHFWLFDFWGWGCSSVG